MSDQHHIHGVRPVPPLKLALPKPWITAGRQVADAAVGLSAVLYQRDNDPALYLYNGGEDYLAVTLANYRDLLTGLRDACQRELDGLG